MQIYHSWFHIIQICSGITRGRVPNAQCFIHRDSRSYINLFAFTYRFFHEDFSPLEGAIHGFYNNFTCLNVMSAMPVFLAITLSMC